MPYFSCFFLFLMHLDVFRHAMSDEFQPYLAKAPSFFSCSDNMNMFYMNMHALDQYHSHHLSLTNVDEKWMHLHKISSQNFYVACTGSKTKTRKKKDDQVLDVPLFDLNVII